MAKILYFAALVDKLGRASEEVELPAAVGDVQSLLSWLRERGTCAAHRRRARNCQQTVCHTANN